MVPPGAFGVVDSKGWVARSWADLSVVKEAAICDADFVAIRTNSMKRATTASLRAACHANMMVSLSRICASQISHEGTVDQAP